MLAQAGWPDREELVVEIFRRKLRHPKRDSRRPLFTNDLATE